MKGRDGKVQRGQSLMTGRDGNYQRLENLSAGRDDGTSLTMVLPSRPDVTAVPVPLKYRDKPWIFITTAVLCSRHQSRK